MFFYIVVMSTFHSFCLIVWYLYIFFFYFSTDWALETVLYEIEKLDYKIWLNG